MRAITILITLFFMSFTSLAMESGSVYQEGKDEKSPSTASENTSLDIKDSMLVNRELLKKVNQRKTTSRVKSKKLETYTEGFVMEDEDQWN